jgi:predicted AAA+ superfamily ATPase
MFARDVTLNIRIVTSRFHGDSAEMDLDRPRHRHEIERLLRSFPVVAVLGARQVGKTTLARTVASSRASTFFDLESPTDRARLADPMLALEDLRGLVVLDEVQRAPGVFAPLRVLADRRPRRARFLVLGSASPLLLRQASESLAGRIAFYELPGFDLEEAGMKNADKLWLRGGFPEAYLARTERQSIEWREQFVRTFLERDLPELGIRIPAVTMRRFWTMLAHYHGQTLNLSELGRSLGVSDNTIRGYVETLENTFMVRTLRPWHENLSKRQVKAPKLFFRDTGLLHHLLGIRSRAELMAHPRLGASWEGFVIETILERGQLARDTFYFWATHGGAEIDLVRIDGKKRIGYEIKRTSAPSITPSIRSALDDLSLDRIFVIYPGAHRIKLAARVEAIPLADALGV